MEKGLKPGMRGAFCEFDDHNRRRFVEIHTIEYDEVALSRLKEINGLEESVMQTFLQLIDGPVPPNTRFLYKLITYYGVSGISDLWEFNGVF